MQEEKNLELIQNQNDNKEIKEKKYYKCTVPGCEMIFSKKCVLRDHQMAHKKEKPFKCQTCGKQFTQGGNLKTHENRMVFILDINVLLNDVEKLLLLIHI